MKSAAAPAEISPHLERGRVLRCEIKRAEVQLAHTAIDFGGRHTESEVEGCLARVQADFTLSRNRRRAGGVQMSWRVSAILFGGLLPNRSELTLATNQKNLPSGIRLTPDTFSGFQRPPALGKK